MKMLASLVLLIPLWRLPGPRLPSRRGRAATAQEPAKPPTVCACADADAGAAPAATQPSPRRRRRSRAAPAAESKPAGESWLSGSLQIGVSLDSQHRRQSRYLSQRRQSGRGVPADRHRLHCVEHIQARFRSRRRPRVVLGGDPYNTLRVDVQKNGWYRLTADYRSIAYFNFLPTFANPALNQGRCSIRTHSTPGFEPPTSSSTCFPTNGSRRTWVSGATRSSGAALPASIWASTTTRWRACIRTRAITTAAAFAWSWENITSRWSRAVPRSKTIRALPTICRTRGTSPGRSSARSCP